MINFYDLPEPCALRRSLALKEAVKIQIEQAGGLISFAVFMQQALYHPDFGYYTSDTFTLGKKGDFVTAPETSPLFAQCFATQCLQLFSLLGCENILELGAGTGRFAYDFLSALKKNGNVTCRYSIYEISPRLREQQQNLIKNICPEFYSRMIWLDVLPTDFSGIILANEVLDALPVHCFHVAEDGIKEKCVTFADDQFNWKFVNPITPGLASKVTAIQKEHQLNNGYESEINLSLINFIETITACLKKGVILFADYGYGAREYYHPQRNRGTLTCFYQQRKHNNPFILLGLQDITAHVDFTHLIETASENDCSLMGYTTQAAFLFSCGLLDLAQEQEKDLSQEAEFNLHQAIKTLTFPTEMGERIKVMALGKNISSFPIFGFSTQDRSRFL